MSEQLEIIPTEQFQITKAQFYAIKFESFKTGIASVNERTAVINYESPTDADAKLSRELRLEAVKIRTGADKEKSNLKEGLLTEGNIIQSEFNLVKAICEETESKLAKVEKHREIELQKIKDQLRIERTEKLKPYVDDVTIFPIAEMSAEAFDSLVEGQRLAYEARAEKFRISEEERLAKEKEEAEAKEAQRLENIRLKVEAEEKEKVRTIRNEQLRPYIFMIRDYNKMLNMDEEAYQKEFAEIEIGAQQHYAYEAEQKAKRDKELAKEQYEQEVKAKKQAAEKRRLEKELSEAKEKLQAEAKAKKDHEAKEKKEEEDKLKAEKEAAKAPDKIKLQLWIDMMKLPDSPAGISNESVNTATEIALKFTAFKDWANKKVNDI